MVSSLARAERGGDAGLSKVEEGEEGEGEDGDEGEFTASGVIESGASNSCSTLRSISPGHSVQIDIVVATLSPVPGRSAPYTSSPS